ncbi:MAG: InlB B-repeat-containing protein [Salinivirgaceae bacterium]|nr:InlB B-repeat-containing protein [Salinivirgaceae bacterium]
MKKLLSSFVILLAAFAAVAQNSFSYQSVIRADGKVLENKSISLRLSIMLDDSICYQEQHAVTTNAYGNVNVSVGEGEPLKGSFDAVPWESMRVMMRIEADVNGGADFTDLGSMQIMPVPYAMYAHRTTTVIQPAEASEEPIFEINDSNGNPMFAVYETGVKVFVEYDESEKAAKSRFAVAGRSAGKEADIDLLTIDESGTLVYVDDDNENKAAKSKFAVAGRPGRKGDQQNNLLAIDGSGSTIYVDNNENKAAKSKFAVAGRPGRKGASDTYFTIDENGTLVYVDDASANKAAKSKFAVAGRPGRKGGQQNNMLTIDGSGSTIYVDENGSKAAKSKFAVAGRPGRKGADSQSENKFTIDGDGSTIYVDFNSSDKAAKSRFAVAGRPGRKDASENVMSIDGDQATFYIDVDDNDKAAKSRFAVAGRPGKGDAEPYFIIDQFGSVIYIDEADSKAAKSRFAVAGRSGKGSDNYFTINRDSTRIYINDAPVADTTTGEIVVPSLASGFAVVGMVQKSDLLAVSKDSTIIKIDTYVAEEVQSVSGEVSKIIDDSKADKSYSSGALYLPLVKSEGVMTTRKKFLINYTYYHSDNGEYLYLKTQFKSGSDLINTVRNYYIVDGQVYGDNTYYVKYIEAGEPTIMPYSEVNPDFKEKLKLNLKSDNDLLVILESTMRDSAYSALAEDGRTAFYSPNGDHGKVMESERNIVAMMNDSARSLFSGNLNVFYSLLDTAVRVTQTVGMSYLTSLQWNYGTVSDFYNIDLSDYYYTLYDGDITDENIKITENYQDFTMRGDYQRRNLTEIETMFAGLKEGFDINAQPNNAAWGSVEKPATKVNYGDSINLVPVAAEGCIFLGWNDGCIDSVRRIGITGPINYTANFQPATYYVSNKNSNDDFDGLSAQTPLASLSKALEKINGLGKADASFTINISGLFVNGTTVTIGACAAKSLTIAGTDKQTDGFKINAEGNLDAENKSVLCVANSTTKVTLKNLKITGGRQYGGYASPLYVGGENINANVLLDNVLITENGVNGNTETICCAGVLVVEGSTLTIGQGTVIENNYVSGNGAAIVNSGTTVMKGGFIGNNIGDEYAPMDIYNYGEFTIDGDVEVGNVVVYYEYSSSTFKTITIGSHFDATADIVGTFAGLYGYYNNETQVLTLPDGLSDDQKKAICDKFAVAPYTDSWNNPISYWKVGISGKLEQVGHVVFVAEQEITSPWGTQYEYVPLLEYNLDFGSQITEKPADPEGDYMYLWYKMGENGQETTEYIFDENAKITADEPYIEFKGIVVPTKCYVSFDTKVDGIELAPQEVAYGAKLSEQWLQTLQNLQSNQDFKKDGYTFAGWCVEEDLWDSSHKRIIDQRLVPFDFEQPITANVTLIANWVANELYVDVNNGSDNNSGIASNKAFETIQKAIDIVKYWNVTDKDYTINVSGSSDEKVRIGDADQYPYAIAKTITLQGTGENSGLTNNSKNYYTMLKVGPNNEVVINNFKFNPVGEIYDNKGKAIYVCVNAKVTLSEGTILDGANAGEYQSNNSCYGGGVYVEGGTLVMESDAVIRNFKVKNGGGVYVTYKESYLYDANTGNSSTEYKQGTFTMKGDAVIQNCNGGNGAGVNVGGYEGYQSTFTMEDNAKIEGCTGIGVEVGSNATFNMYGSTRIETCSDRGVEVSNGGTFNMFGNSAIGGSEGKGCTGGLSIYGGEAIMNENASISYNTGVANGAGVRVGGGGSFMMTGGTIAYNIAKAEGQYSAGAQGCGVYVETNGKNATEAWTSVFEMRGGSIYGNTATEATPAIYGRGVFVASSYYENNSSHPFFESTFMLKGGNIAADNDVALQMKKMSDDTYQSAKITVAGTLADEALVAITPYYTQNNQHQSGLQVLTTADGAGMQNDKFAVTDQVVGTTTTYWKVDSEGKLAQRTVVTFMNNGTEFAKMPVGNNGKVAEPATKPTSTDKVFTGWYTDAEGTIPFNFNNEVGSTTTTLYAGWGDPEVYVPSAPSGAAGAMTAASLAKAVELINSKDAPDLDWTIKINGQLNGKQVISGTIAADTIILIGARDLDANGVPRDMLNGNFTEPTDSAVLNIFATNPVIIKNLKITGGNNTTDIWTDQEICGGGLHVASGAKVSLTDGVVIDGNKAYAGGGAYVKGIMYMYGSAVIGDANATKAPVGESDCANYASQYGGGVYVAGGSFYMGCNSCTMSVVNEQAVYEYNYKELTGGVFGNRSNYDGGGVYSSGSYAKVYMNSGVIANNSALKNGGAVRNAAARGFILSGDAYIPAGADFKHDVYLENGYANVTIDGTLTHEKVAQIMPTKTTTSTSLGYDNKYSDYGSLDDKNNQYGKFTITPFVISETAPNTITYYQYTYVNGYGIKATANGSAQNIPQFTQITLSDNVFGGDVVTATITGENFTNQMLNFTSICLNDTMVNATFTLESATEITATFPAPATAGTRTVKVQTYGAEPLAGALEVNAPDPHTFYVKPQSEGGDDSKNGLTPATAIASLGTALNKIKNGDGNTETEYTIKVMGTTLGNISITNDLNSKAGRITFEGATKPVQGKEPEDVITGSSSNPVLSIQTTVPITIKNLKITDGNSMLGGGINVNAANADVTLDDGALITENSASNDGGGGVDILQGKLTMLAGSKISGNHAISGGSGGGVAIYENGTLDMKGGEISGNTTSMVGSGVYVQGTMIMSGGAVVAADNDVSLASGNTVTVGNLAEGENTVATITPQNYPSTTSQVQVLSGEYVATEYSRFAVTPQGNSDNPSMPSEWEVNGEGILIKISPVVVTLTHSNIQEFTPDEEKSYEFIFDNTVTDSDLEYFCYNYDINRSSTLDMSQATLIANVNRLPAYLITVVLPPNVESISSDAFANIAFRGEATSVTIADGNAHYKTIDGVLFGEKDTWGTGISNLLFYPPAKSGSTYEIPSFVTRIEDCGFMYNKNLVTINGLERIVYLQTFVFVECQKLQSANLSGVTMSGYNLFRNCQALESVTWGKAGMLWAVFADCPKLEQIHFTSATPPSYLGEYGDYPVEFYGCNSNLKFYVPAGSRNAYLNATSDNGFYSSANACYDGNSYGYSGSLADRIIEEGTSYIGSKAPGSQLAVGDIVFNDGSAEYYTNIAEEQKSAAIAVIFYKGTDCSNNGGERTLGVGLKQDASGLAWCVAGAEASSVDITSIKCEPSGSAGAYTFEASYDKNGSDNLKQIADFFGKDVTEIEADYPAFYWAKNYTTDTIVAGSEYATGWYFPSAAEFYSLSSQVTMVNAAMDACGGTKFETGKNYWTSSQSKAEVVNAIGFVYNASVGFVATSFKKDGSNVLRICAIRDFSTGGGSTSQTTPDWMISDGQGHYYVDLGTNTLWATTNIGAENPQDFGDYFAWGETEPYYLSATGTWNDGKKGYYWKNYKYTDGTDTTKLTRYYSHTNYGDSPDYVTSLDIQDDAASVNWGGNWVMPTSADGTELMSNCYCPWVNDYNDTGVPGRIVYRAKSSNDKGKIADGEASYGLSDPHIFLPAAGYFDGVDKITNDTESRLIGEYWYSENLDGRSAFCLEPQQAHVIETMNARCYGLTVRPVIRNP